MMGRCLVASPTRRWAAAGGSVHCTKAKSRSGAFRNIAKTIIRKADLLDRGAEMFRRFLYRIRSLIPSQTSGTPLDVDQPPGKKYPRGSRGIVATSHHMARTNIRRWVRLYVASVTLTLRGSANGFVALRRQCDIIADFGNGYMFRRHYENVGY
jgi:hypothetical protein